MEFNQNRRVRCKCLTRAQTGTDGRNDFNRWSVRV